MAKKQSATKKIVHPSQRDESKYVDRINMVLDFMYVCDVTPSPGKRKRGPGYRLTPNAHHVLILLAARVDQEEPEHDRTYVGLSYLSERTRLAPSAVSAALKELKDKNIIHREVRINRWHSRFSVINWDTLRGSHYPMSEKRQKAWDTQERSKGNDVNAELFANNDDVADDLSDMDGLAVHFKLSAQKPPISKPLPPLIEVLKKWLPNKLTSAKQLQQNVDKYTALVVTPGLDPDLLSKAVEWLSTAEDPSPEMVRVRDLIAHKDTVIPICQLGYKWEQINEAYRKYNSKDQPQAEDRPDFAPAANDMKVATFIVDKLSCYLAHPQLQTRKGKDEQVLLVLQSRRVMLEQGENEPFQLVGELDPLLDWTFNDPSKAASELRNRWLGHLLNPECEVGVLLMWGLRTWLEDWETAKRRSMEEHDDESDDLATADKWDPSIEDQF